MKHISILILNKMRLSSEDIPRHAFLEVNAIIADQSKPPLFDVQKAGLENQVSLNDGLFTVSPDAFIKDMKDTNLIIVPAMDGHLRTAIAENTAFIPWLIAQNKNGAEVDLERCSQSPFMIFSGQKGNNDNVILST